MKICSRCKTEKHESSYHVDKRDTSGLRAWCKECVADYFQGKDGKEARHKYQNTTKGRSAQRRYYLSSKGQLARQQNDRRRNERKLLLKLQFTNQDAALVRSRFDNKCFNCNNTEALQIDHHLPLSKGYGLTLDNAVLLCKSCNCKKHSKIPEEFYTKEQLKMLNEFFLQI